MTKFALYFLMMAIVFGIGYLVLIFGWGLEARSWGWILGGAFVQIFVASILRAAEE